MILIYTSGPFSLPIRLQPRNSIFVSLGLILLISPPSSFQNLRIMKIQIKLNHCLFTLIASAHACKLCYVNIKTQETKLVCARKVVTRKLTLWKYCSRLHYFLSLFLMTLLSRMKIVIFPVVISIKSVEVIIYIWYHMHHLLTCLAFQYCSNIQVSRGFRPVCLKQCHMYFTKQ